MRISHSGRVTRTTRTERSPDLDFDGRNLLAATRDSCAWAALVRGEERITFRFDPSQIPYLGIWLSNLSNRGWNGFTHVAIEPTNAMTDSLLRSRNELLASHAGRT